MSFQIISVSVVPVVNVKSEERELSLAREEGKKLYCYCFAFIDWWECGLVDRVARVRLLLNSKFVLEFELYG